MSAHIFVCEDDLPMAQDLCAILRKYGYEADFTRSFSNVAADIAVQKPDLVLLDINLPQYDGFHICRELRKASEIPVIMITSRDSEMDELMSMNLGADDYVTKPFNMQILLAHIASVLRRSAPVQEKPKAYDSQTVEVAGITYESVAHGTFYRGDAKLQDGFYLHIKITNNNTKNRTFSSFNVHAAQGDLEAGDPLFTSGKAAVLDYVTSEAPDELHEGIDLSERPDIGPGETVEYVYFWAPKTAYYGPITVEFVDAYAPAKNHEAMHFDTTGCETKEFKAAGGVADSGEKADLTGIDCASYSIEAADGYTLDSSDEEREKANFFHDETGGRLNISIFPRSPEEEVASLEQVYEGKETTTDQVEYNGITWLRFTGPDNGHTLFATAPATGETVRVSIGWKIDWDAAVPMMEALKLK